MHALGQTDPHRSTVLLRWSRVLRWSAALLLLLAVAVAVWAAEVDVPVVLGTVVVGPVVVGPAVALVGTVVAVGAAATGLAAQEAGAPEGSRRRIIRWPVNAAKLALLVAGWTGALVAFQLGLGLADASMLRPVSAEGCRVVVVQHMSGAVSVHVAPAGAIRSRMAGRLADAGHAPVTLGTHTLTWDGETASLTLQGVSLSYGDDEARPARLDVDCSTGGRGPRDPGQSHERASTAHRSREPGRPARR